MNNEPSPGGQLEPIVSPRDRELLELAAKAAGYKIRNECLDPREDFAGFRIKGDGMEHTGNGPWNPLVNDADALRLAVRLRLDVLFGPADVEVTASQIPDGDGVCPWSWFATEPGDSYKATRRAIVQAAAEAAKRANS